MKAKRKSLSIYIALFGSINVGGKNKIPMQFLKKIMEENGYVKVRTYIQSGNILFQSSSSKAASFTRNIGRAINNLYNLQPTIIVLEIKKLKKALEANPFPSAEKNPKFLHLYFLACIPKNPDFESLSQIKSETESFQLIGNVFYLYTPNGFGRSKLAARVGKLLKVEATARNWNTVSKLIKIADEM